MARLFSNMSFLDRFQECVQENKGVTLLQVRQETGRDHVDFYWYGHHLEVYDSSLNFPEKAKRYSIACEVNEGEPYDDVLKMIEDVRREFSHFLSFAEGFRQYPSSPGKEFIVRSFSLNSSSGAQSATPPPPPDLSAE